MKSALMLVLKAAGVLVLLIAALVGYNYLRHLIYWLPAEEVTFQSEGGVELAGTLLMPEGEAPHAAVVMLHGSGPEGRSGPGYRILSNHIARSGVAVLFYDKRGVGESGGDFSTAQYPDFVDDAVAAVEFLERRDDIDSSRIGLHTNSEGGWFGPEVAVRTGHVSFIFNRVAPPFAWLDNVIWEVRNDALAAGVPESQIDQVLDVRRRSWQYYVDTHADPSLSSGPVRDAINAELKRVVRESGPTLIAFILGSAAVVAGTIIGVALLDLGPNEAELAGIFTGTYIGGGLNFAAVAEATGMQESSELTAAVAADQVITNLHFLLIILIPGIAWMAKRYPTHHMDNAETFAVETDGIPHQLSDLSLPGLLAALALAFLVATVGNSLAAMAGYPQYGILIITAIALAIATFAPRQVERLSGYREAGNVMMFIFLGSIAAGADIWELIEIAPVMFVYASIIIIVHMVILFGIGYFMRLDLAELAMASAVCIGGPSSAPALASAKGWRDLLIPGILCGSLGYGIGSFIGVRVTTWLT